MSIEAVSWVLNSAPIPRDRRDASSLTVVLLGLANHADPAGRNAFPAVSTLTRYTRLSERSVQYALRALEELDLIRPSDPTIVAAYVKRSDRRPRGWDLAVHRCEGAVDNPADGVQSLRPVDLHGVQNQRHGVQTATSRGAELAPETSLNRPKNRPSRERAPEARSLPAECGECDARPGDPISARLIWTDEDRTQSVPCPRCAPARSGGAR
ncbi:helix-turn-helix domain-containing protein [Saccharothrix syringae]|uniref:Helix-turn-helix domain-containing protein n=1 Tax=Saccharothrix syringae TaxID=103733 RepID=A0A5Q0GW28_SACSY|nr:helix-turn-helix domain-containing protein [Saccharothrix syringae]QFZ17552.1 helix-turn-helix domain-containing protein [Saccharothrix syringae]